MSTSRTHTHTTQRQNVPESAFALVDVHKEVVVVTDESSVAETWRVAEGKAVAHCPPHHSTNHGVAQVLEEDVGDGCRSDRSSFKASKPCLQEEDQAAAHKEKHLRFSGDALAWSSIAFWNAVQWDGVTEWHSKVYGVSGSGPESAWSLQSLRLYFNRAERALAKLKRRQRYFTWRKRVSLQTSPVGVSDVQSLSACCWRPSTHSSYTVVLFDICVFFSFSFLSMFF